MDDEKEKQQIMREVKEKIASELRVLEGAINRVINEQFEAISQRIAEEIMEKYGVKVDVSIPGIKWEAISEAYPFILQEVEA